MVSNMSAAVFVIYAALALSSRALNKSKQTESGILTSCRVGIICRNRDGLSSGLSLIHNNQLANGMRISLLTWTFTVRIKLAVAKSYRVFISSYIPRYPVKITELYGQYLTFWGFNV